MELTEESIARGMAHLRRVEPKLVATIDRGARFSSEKKSADFLAFCRAIIGQQLSKLAADKIWKRFENVFTDADPADWPIAINHISDATLRAVGLSAAKTRSVRELAACWQAHSLSAAKLAAMSDHEIIDELIKVKGIGPWTVRMVLIFRLRRANVLPTEDLGLRVALQRLDGLSERPTPLECVRRCAPWAPFATLGTHYCWEFLRLEKQTAV